MQYTIEDLKKTKIVIDFRGETGEDSERCCRKLTSIMMAAYPKKHLPKIGAAIYYYGDQFGWAATNCRSELDWLQPIMFVTVDDIILPATATKQEK